MHFNNISIRWQIMITFSVLLLLALGTLTFSLYKIAETSLVHQVEYNLKTKSVDLVSYIENDLTLEKGQGDYNANLERIKNKVASFVIGKTGYVYILDSKGNYVVSKDRERDGENIWNEKDAEGVFFIREIIQKGKNPDSTHIQYYPWLNKNEAHPRMKLAAVTYMPDLDWYVCASAYHQDFLSEIQSMKVYSFILIDIFIAISLIFSWLIAYRITKPIRAAVDATDRISRGDMDIRFDIHGKNEITQLLQAMQRMAMTVQSVITEIGSVTDAVFDGKLDARANTSNFNGKFEHIMTSYNDSLNALILPLNVTAEYVDRISKGDLPPLIVETYRGDLNEIKNNLNACITTIKMMTEDVNLLINAAQKEEYATRVDASRHTGEFYNIINGVNTLLDDVVNKVFWFEQLLNSIPFPISVTDMDMNWTFVNAAAKQLDPTKQIGMLGKKCDNWELDICKTSNCGITCLRSGQPTTFFAQQDNNKHFQVDTNYLLDINNKQIGHIEVIQDISYQKTAERKIQKVNDELTLALEEAQKSKELEIMNTRLRVSQEKTDLLNEELQLANEHLFTKNEELESILKKLKDTKTQLIQSEKMASVGLLIAGVAHEINNPLNYIHGGEVGLTRYFEKNLHDHMSKVHPLLNGIKIGVKRASDIVNSLNQFNRSTDAYDENCDIHNIIDDCLVMLHNKLKHRIELLKNYTEDKIIVIGNAGQLHQVFLNILVNSEQAIAEQGTITITTTTDNENVFISITDTGEGISEENLSKITDPFFTTKEPGKGTGLGLSIAYTILQEHKGSMNYQSNLGKGTTVLISFPINHLGQ